MAIEIIAKLKQKNNGNFKLMDAVDVELSNGEDLQTYLDNLETGGESVVFVGNSPPVQEEIDKYDIFIDRGDDSNFQGAVNNISSVFIQEMKDMFTSMQNTILQQQKAINELEARIVYLETLHGKKEEERTQDALILENGSLILLENGGTLLLDNTKFAPEIHDPSIMLENGGFLLTENGGRLVFEEGSTQDIKINRRILLENGGMLLLENGGILHLENSSKEEIKNAQKLLLETGGLLQLENGGSLHLENSYIELDKNGEAIIKLENGGDLLLEDGSKLLLELSDEEYSLLIENGKIFLNEKDGKIILE